MKSAVAGLLLCCALIAPLRAQLYRFKSIVFDGAPQYNSAELLSMSGLGTGLSLSDDDLKLALHKLDDTGLFRRINYKTDGTTLRITLEPMAGSETRAVRYSNFVIATPEELNAQVHQRLPAFTGKVPASGELEQQVAHALEAILKQRGIVATVTSIADESGGVDYSIATPRVVIGKLVLAGVDLSSDRRLAALRDRITGSDYVEGQSADALRTNLLDAFHDLGYVDAVIGPISHGAPALSPARITVDLDGAVQPGPLYTIAHVVLPNIQPRVTEDELLKANQLKVGAPASRIEVLSTQHRLEIVYEGRGYLDAKTAIDFTKDDSAHTLSYTFKTVPGEEYTFRSLLTPGLNEEQADAVRKLFKLPAGAIYDGAAAGIFNSATLHNECNGRPMKIALRKELRTHLVDVLASCDAVLH